MKHRFKKIISLVLCFSLLFIGIGSVTKSKAAVPTYTDSGKDYTIRQLLSDYQYFTKKHFKTSNHFVGALACGGDAYFNSFGNGAIVPSYIKNVIHSGNYSGQYDSHFLAKYPQYKNLLKQPAYYKTILSHNSSLTQYPDKKKAYIDFDTASEKLNLESTALKKNSALTISDKNLKTACIDGQKGLLLTIPFSASKRSVYIPSEYILLADWIMIDGVKDLDELVSTDHIITIGKCDLISIGSDYSYVASGDLKKAVFISTKNSDGKDISFLNNNSHQKAYLLDDGHGLKNLKKSETIQAGQMDLSGMKLIWNFPDNAFLTCEYLPGHIVAPNALVTIKGGNFEGGYIANSIVNHGAEGHFYPYKEVTEPEQTPKPEFSKTPKPSCSKTPKPRVTPTVTPTISITPSPTPTVTPTVSVAPSLSPTPTVSVAPSPSPTPTVTPTVSVAPSPSPTSTVTPTVSVAPSPSHAPTITPTVSVAPSPSHAPTITPTVSVAPSPNHAPTITPTVSVAPSSTPSSNPATPPAISPSTIPSATPTITPAPTPAPNPSPSNTPAPSRTPTPWFPPSYPATPSPKPTVTPVPTNTPKPSATPGVTISPVPANTPKPTGTPGVTASPIPTAAAAPSGTPAISPAPTATAAPSATPDTTKTPTDNSTDDIPPANTAAPREVIISKYPPADEQQLPSGQKGSPSTGEENNTVPFAVVTIISGLGILFLGLKLATLKKDK